MSAIDPMAGTASSLHFDRFVLDLGRASLTRDGCAVALRPKSFALLSYLATHPGRVLGKDELLAAVWPGVVVTDDSLSQCVNELRAAIGDREQRLIRTVPRRGYLFDTEVETEAAKLPMSLPAAAPRARVGSTLRLARMGAIVALVSAVTGLSLFPSDSSRVDIDTAMKARRSIAVLPFSDLGEDKRPYFAEAVTEDLAANLARLPQTLVIAQASAAAVHARESDVREIGRALGVQYLLAGNVRRDGEAVHIGTQLIAAETGAVLWSGSVDYPNANAWAWQRDIALRIARTLDLQLSSASPAARSSGKPVEAVDAVMQGYYLLRHSWRREDFHRARADFTSALAVDPDSVAALCGLALAHLAEVQLRLSSDPQAQTALAVQAIERALTIDPDDAFTHYAKGNALFVRGDLEGALREYQRVLMVNPSDAWAHARIGAVMLGLGRLEEVAGHIAAAQRLNPLEATQVGFGHYIAGVAEFNLGNEEKAYRRMQLATGATPNMVQPWVWLAAIDGLRGRQDKAAENLRHAARILPEISIALVQRYNDDRPTPPRFQANVNRFVEGLRKAGLPEHAAVN